MSAPGQDYSIITRFIRKMRGGSQPILAQANDGLFYIIKFNNNLQGSNLPFNESIGGELFRACGLAVPSWRPLLATDAFLDQNPDCWLETSEGRLRPDSGLCFGSQFLGRDGIRLFEILPGTSFKRVRNLPSFWLAWLIDICALHADNRQAIFLETTRGDLEASFIDGGHLFGGPKGELRPHFFASCYIDLRIYQGVSSQYLLEMQRVAGSIDVDRLWKRMQELPEDWKTTSALDGFAHCLDRLASRKVLLGTMDLMSDVYERTNRFESTWIENRRKPPVGVLHPGVQAARLQRRFVTYRLGHRTCA